ncbi:MAG: four helix bundle protein [Bacteroidales bacterium]|nr:four helix bundle protein [Bacteroidales bacterium]
MKTEDIVTWQKAKEFSNEIHKMDIENKDFEKLIREASLNIAIHISKGFERVINSEFLKHLYLAQENCSEVKTLMYKAYELNYIDDEQKEKLFEKSEEVNKLIGGFIKHIRNKMSSNNREE